MCMPFSFHAVTQALLEGFDFAGALAQRLADLVKARVLEPTGCLWYWAVDQLLMLTVDAHTQVGLGWV